MLVLFSACSGKPQAPELSVDLQFSEAPMLTELAVSGELPPLQDRLPLVPLVKRTVESIGTYGGTSKVLASSKGPYNDMQGGLEGANLLRVAPDGITVEPSIASGYAWASEETKEELFLFLREGLKWSDGQPFVAEDIRFMFEDMHLAETVRTWNGADRVTKVKAKGDYTAMLEVPGGQASLPLHLAGWGGGRVSGYAPAHYMKKWHLKYNPDAKKVGASEGYAKWEDALWSHYWWDPQKDLDKPTLRPWLIKESDGKSKLYERNPYYWAVDEEGNQLPYIDRIEVDIYNKDEFFSRVLNGESDMFYVESDLDDVEQYRALAEGGEFRLILWPGNNTSEFTLEVNQFHTDKVYGGMLEDVRFRQALSLALDRKAINEKIYGGYGVPSQMSVLPSSSFYQTEWAFHFASYDPDAAGRLLDEMGIEYPEKGAGNRRDPEGFPFLLRLAYSNPNLTEALEMAKGYWEDIGINVNIYLLTGEELSNKARAGDFMVVTGSSQNGDERTLFREEFLWDSWATRTWWRWDQTTEDAFIEARNGRPAPADYRYRKPPEDDELETKIEGTKPPDFFMDFLDDRDAWLLTTPGSEEYRRLGQKVFDTYSKNLWSIGVVGTLPKPWLVRKTYGNIPEPGAIAGMPLDHLLVMMFVDQFYLKPAD
jgi:peptide/nickel transport system substrate-binding protein